MAVYKYLDTDGKQQSVNVFWRNGECKKGDFLRGGRRTGGYEKWTATGHIELSNPLPYALKVNTLKSEAIALYNSTQKTVNTPTTITVPRGTVKHPVTFYCRYDYINDSIKKSSIFNYEIVNQEDVPEEQEDFQIINPQDLNFKESSDMFAVFSEKQPAGNSKNIIWQIELRTRAGLTPSSTGRVTRKRVERQGLPTASTEITLAGTPLDFEQRAQKRGDVYAPLAPMAVTLNMLAVDEGELEHIGMAADAELRLDIIRNGVLYFQGYNLASAYSEAYASAPHAVSIDFGCGLALLKKIPYEIDEEAPRKPTIDIITKCLKKINSDLSVLIGVYQYPNEMPRSLGTSPYQGCELDERVYQDNKGIYSCGRVLEEIVGKDLAVMFLAPPGDTFTSFSVAWYIIEQNSRIQDLPMLFFQNGEVTSSRTPANKLVIGRYGVKQPYQINATSSQRVSKETVREVEIERKLDYIPQLFPDGEFGSDSGAGRNDVKGWTKFGEPETRLGLHGGREIKTGRGGIGIVDGNYSVKIKGRLGSDVFFPKAGISGQYTQPDQGYESNAVQMYVENGNSFSVYMGVRWVSDSQPLMDYLNGNPDNLFRGMLLPIQIKLGSKYLNEDNTWTTDENTLYISSTLFGTWFTWSMENVPVPEDGSLSMKIIAPLWPVENQIGSTTVSNLLSSAPLYADIDFVRGQNLTESGFATTSNTIYAINPLSRSNSEPYKKTMIHADVDTLQNISAITYKGELTTTWQRYYGPGEALPLGELAAKKIFDNFTRTDTYKLQNFQVIENGSRLNFGSVVTTAEMPDRRFICTSWRYTPVTPTVCGVMTCDWIEINNANVTPTFTNDKGEGTYGSAGGGSGGGGNPILPTVAPFDIFKYLTPGQIQTPAYVSMYNGKLAIDIAGLVLEGGGVEQDLEAVTKIGNRSSKDILIGSIGATTAYTRLGVLGGANRIEISSTNRVEISNGPRTVLSIQGGDLYHSNFGDEAYTPYHLLVKSNTGKVRGVLPAEIIKVRNGIKWSNGFLESDIQTNDAFDKDYNSLRNRPVTNYVEYIQINKALRMGAYVATRGYTYLLGLDANNEIIRNSASGFGIATQNYVNGRGFATETWVRNYVANNGGSTSDKNYYLNAINIQSDGRLKATVVGYGTIYSDSLDNRYERRGQGGGGGTYSLPTASVSVKGGVRVSGSQGIKMTGDIIYLSLGSGLAFNNSGQLYALGGGGGGTNPYNLPTMSRTTKGGATITGNHGLKMIGTDLLLNIGTGLAFNNNGQVVATGSTAAVEKAKYKKYTNSTARTITNGSNGTSYSLSGVPGKILMGVARIQFSRGSQPLDESIFYEISHDLRYVTKQREVANIFDANINVSFVTNSGSGITIYASIFSVNGNNQKRTVSNFEITYTEIPA